MNNRKKILVVGAGFAGISAAYWLGRLGHGVVVVERFPHLRDTGAQVDLRSPGVEIAERMGILGQIEACRVHEEGFEMIDRHGRVKARMMADASGSITAEYELMRGDFLRILYEASEDRAEFRFGTAVRKFEQDADHVEVEFDNGSSEVFDLMVAADGQGSRVRAAILPADAPDPYRRSGVSIAYWVVDRDASDSNIAKMFNAPGGRLLVRRSHSDDETQIYFFLRDKSPEARTIHRRPVEEQKEFWAQKLKGVGWQEMRFHDALMASDNFYCHEIVQIATDTWHQGRVVLIGDAAHALPPAGWGVTSSLVGSYLMAHELQRNPDDHQVAFSAYKAAMTPYIKSKEPVSFAAMRILLPTTGLGISLFHAGGRLARSAMLTIAKLKGMIGTTTGEHSRRGQWVLPTYDIPTAAG